MDYFMSLGAFREEKLAHREPALSIPFLDVSFR
jgi:hypothetical protein